MGDWNSYSLQDLVMISREAYVATLGQYRADYPTAVIVWIGLALGMNWALWQRRFPGLVLGTVAAALLWVAWFPLNQYLGTLTWVAPYAAGGLASGGLGLAFLAIRKGSWHQCCASRRFFIGWALFAFASLVPLTSPAPVVFGTGPEGTALAAVGVILTRRWHPMLLMPLGPLGLYLTTALPLVWSMK